MELNAKQNMLISTFHQKFGHEDASGNFNGKEHITDIRRLVEDCLLAADEKQDAVIDKQLGENETV